MLKYQVHVFPHPLKIVYATFRMEDVIVKVPRAVQGDGYNAISQTTLEFAKKEGADIAINAGATLLPKPWDFSDSAHVTNIGAWAFAGEIYNEPDAWPFVNFTLDGRAVIDSNRDRLFTAVAGKMVILKNRWIPPLLDDRHPRTVIGTSHDGRRVYIATALGRCCGSIGATLQEMGAFLKFLGADDGLNLDGGHSSKFVVKTWYGYKEFSTGVPREMPVHILFRSRL